VLAHKLRGTAGSYGFQTVGDAMGQIEDSVINLTADPNKRESLWSTAEGALSRAIESVDQPANFDETDENHWRTRVLTAIARLLVVDDDENFLRLTAALARRQLIEVVQARSAVEALQKAVNCRADAALIDANLSSPEESLELARNLRFVPGCERLPLAFMSA